MVEFQQRAVLPPEHGLLGEALVCAVQEPPVQADKESGRQSVSQMPDRSDGLRPERSSRHFAEIRLKNVEKRWRPPPDPDNPEEDPPPGSAAGGVRVQIAEKETGLEIVEEIDGEEIRGEEIDGEKIDETEVSSEVNPIE
ncbi:unnamed protein product [Nesidiocoris tenuis]|uniref:Uncharacterized protein n=1 Tax=Nesidiocoris tenuis TaxID=355587 RepID=A0A6H5HB27_9HEMI|nr:unnamed protein product [Nesidiocoris tenuis]